jgi:SCF-associated factor 1
MPGIQDLPVEVLLDNFLPIIELKSLLNLSCTNKYFAELGNEDLLWKRKLLDDYNFNGTRTARKSGWKAIYKGLVSVNTLRSMKR